MDIRNAKGPVKGTLPPNLLTPEKEQPAVPAYDEAGTPEAPLLKYGNDPVIAQYMKYLEDNDIGEEDIHVVFDALVSSGNVSWSFKLLDSIPVSFRIRPVWVNDYILEVVDKETAGNEHVSLMRYNNLVAVCNLAGSMTAFKDEQYCLNSPEDFAAARTRVQNLPYIIQNALVNKLAVFDRVIAVATSSWAVKNFTKPRKEK